jgi:hypothetical protein
MPCPAASAPRARAQTPNARHSTRHARFTIPGMGNREDWGRTEDDLMRARGAVDEVLVCLGLAPAHFDENLRARVRGVAGVAARGRGGGGGECLLVGARGLVRCSWPAAMLMLHVQLAGCCAARACACLCKHAC